MKNILNLLICVFSVSFCYSQKIEKDDLEVCIKRKVINFLIEKKRLSPNELNNLNSIHISELVESKVLGYNENGIYYVTDYSAHNQNYVFLKKGKSIKIIDPMNCSLFINEISSFLYELKYSNSRTMEYLKASMEIIERNSGRIVDDGFKSQDWIICQ